MKTAAAGALVILPGLEDTITPAMFPIVLAAITFVDHMLRNMTTTSIDQR